MTITFPLSKPFTIDTSKMGPEQKDEKVQRSAYIPLQLIKAVFSSMAQATYSTFKYSGTSFKHIVLGYYGSLREFSPPADIYLAVFKVAFWFLALNWCFITTTGRLFYEQTYPTASSDYVKQFASPEINTEHLSSSDLALNVSHVPSTVKVDGLLTILDSINFNEPTKPGYMAPTSRKEGDTTYTEKQLQENLTKFVTRVNQRVAFLGTPPAYDTPRLMAFYQQIEDAVRLSIDKSNKNLADFRQKYGTAPNNYSPEQTKVYKGLLEDRARIALDLAIAGNHCGARYIGDAMTIYYNTAGDSLQSNLTLQESLHEHLALKRQQIANSHIQQHLSERGAVDTHSYNNYMSNMGQLIGIPGSRNIIEHLSSSFDRSRFLTLFFSEYTVDSIITTLQEAIKNEKGHALRSQITDWVKDQVGDWKKEEFTEKYNAALGQIKTVLNSDKLPDGITATNYRLLVKLWATLTPQDRLTDIDDLFALERVKEWCNTNAPTKTPIGKAQFRNALKEAAKAAPAVDNLESLISETNKIEAIQKIVPLNKETLKRIFKGEIPVEEALQSYLDLTRREELLAEFQLEEMHTQGLSKELLEWIVVSQNILLPQQVQTQDAL